MTPEELDRAIDFLLQHQASAEVRGEQIQEQIEELVVQNKETSAQIAAVSRESDIRDQRVSAKLEKVSEEIQALKDATRDLLDHGSRTDIRLNRIENPDL